MDYAQIYPCIACIARGRVGKWFIFKQYKWFRVVTKYYVPTNPQTPTQQANRALLANAVQYWQGFSDDTKHFYNKKRLPTHMSGYNRYIRFYLEANYPMIIYWEPLQQSSDEPLTIPDYMSESYFSGVQRVRSFADYPDSNPYGGVIYKNNLKEFLGFLKDRGWSNLREWVWRRKIEESWSVDRCTGGTATAETENQPNEGADEAFDDNYTTKWLSSGNPTPWIVYQFPGDNQYTIEKYTITAGNDASDRDPKSWQFQGSNNGSDWDTLHTVTDEYLGSRLQKRTFYLTNNTAYEYYRLNITANWGSGDLQLTEIEMFEFTG